MVKDLRVKEQNSCLTKSFAKLGSLPSAQTKQPTYYSVPQVIGERPSRTSAQEGCNDISNTASATENIEMISWKCVVGVKHAIFFISSIICRRSF